ncbi:MAG: HEAT repeat domain-containing protein [Acidimicrobiia bacterium]
MMPVPAVGRAAYAASLGHTRRATAEELDELEQLARSDPDGRVRAVALGALARCAARRTSAATWRIAARDHDPNVRRRAAELAPLLGAALPAQALLSLLGDAVPLVAEAAAFALGERVHLGPRALGALGVAATTHTDPLVREAAVAALGALGDPSTLPIVLSACDDKPAVRRRAVLALAAFDGEQVEARLRLALTDRDWQVRQAAEDLVASASNRHT